MRLSELRSVLTNMDDASETDPEIEFRDGDDILYNVVEVTLKADVNVDFTRGTLSEFPAAAESLTFIIE